MLIVDEASDGCWTNIKETKNYAEGKLEIAGANLSFKGDKQAIPWDYQGSAFTIAVFAQRHNTHNFCFGNVLIQTVAGTKSYETGLQGVQTYSLGNSIFVHPDNFNQGVLDAVREHVKNWEARN